MKAARSRFCRARRRRAPSSFRCSARVAAGMPIEALEHNETFSVPESFVGRGGSHYVLRVRGNSMVDEQIATATSSS